MRPPVRKIKLHWWILGGILAGAGVGAWFHETRHPRVAEKALREVFKEKSPTAAERIAATEEIQAAEKRALKEDPVGGAIQGVADLFMSLLKMIVIPLVFASLVSGVLGLGDFGRFGRLGGKALGWYVSTSLLAILTGQLLVNVIRPGDGVKLDLPVGVKTKALPDSFWDVVVNMIPKNVVESAAKFDVLPVLVFAIFFGVFALASDEKYRRPVAEFFAGVFEVMMKMTQFIIRLAPIGIAALIASLVATTGPEVFKGLIGYAATVAGGLAVHFFVTLPLLFWIVTRRNPYRVMRAMSPSLLTAFSTASSSATLPLTIDRVENGVGVSNKVSGFVLPLGATVNMDGTALYECVATIFVAQIYAAATPGFELTLGMQATIVFLSLMVSIGAAGIPHAGLVMMVIIFKAVGLPIEMTALLWAVDRPLDMCRTSVNVWSDAMGATAIAHGEGEIDERVLFEPTRDAAD